MCKEYEVYKCKVLIKMLTNRKQNLERAMEIYDKKTFQEALKQMEIIKNG
jgi:hypothetical protein